MNWSLRSGDETVIGDPSQIKLHSHMKLQNYVEPSLLACVFRGSHMQKAE
jgi:hypothetical protein